MGVVEGTGDIGVETADGGVSKGFLVIAGCVIAGGVLGILGGAAATIDVGAVDSGLVAEERESNLDRKKKTKPNQPERRSVNSIDNRSPDATSFEPTLESNPKTNHTNERKGDQPSTLALSSLP